jgi:threonine aldolase
MPRLVPARNGALDIAATAAALVGADAQRPRVGVIVVENTHVRSGGRVVGLGHMRMVAETARAAGVPVHLDGARLFNAASALGVPARDLAAAADSVAFNLNKGLAAPLGAILAGETDFIAEAVRVRQMFGGGWRPAGVPAAAGIVALESMVGRLADDHARARALADGLAELDGIDVDPEAVESNILLVRPGGATPDALSAALARQNVLVLPFGPFLRLVTHHEITDAAVAETLAAFRTVLSAVDL